MNDQQSAAESALNATLAVAPAPRLFSDEDHARVTEAVRAAEKLTAAEIVPVIAAESGRYDRAEDLFGLLIGTLALSLVWFAGPGLGAGLLEPGSWGQWAACLAALVAGFCGGVAWASNSPYLRILLVPVDEQVTEVEERARILFFDHRLRQTTGQTGLLIYLSLVERRAVLLADEAVLRVLGAAGLDAFCQELVSRIPAVGPIAALVEVIQRLGQRLAVELPRAENDGNQLDDALIELD